MLATSPLEWPRQRITISSSKPRALVWLGQFFAPLGSWVGFIDRAPLICTWCVQVLTLGLVSGALWAVSDRRLGPSSPIVLICGLALVFIALGG